MSDISFQDLLHARQAWQQNPSAATRARLNDLSLRRAYQGTKDKSWGILPCEHRFRELEQTLRSTQLGYCKLYGRTVTPDEGDTVETYVFVFDITRKEVERLRSKYLQDPVIYSGPETDGSIVMLSEDGSKVIQSEFSPEKIAQAFSSVKGKNFFFDYPTQGHVEALIETAHRQRSQTL